MLAMRACAAADTEAVEQALFEWIRKAGGEVGSTGLLTAEAAQQWQWLSPQQPQSNQTLMNLAAQRWLKLQQQWLCSNLPPVSP
jgi:hypothetical protein